jgi:hypothetical protein
MKKKKIENKSMYDVQTLMLHINKLEKHKVHAYIALYLT